jgi:hypothetical protein
MKSFQIQYAGNEDRNLWDEFIHGHPLANYYHLFGWREVIAKTYGHRGYYLMAYEEQKTIASNGSERPRQDKKILLGVLPLVHLKHIVFGNYLISLPFLDGGGILTSQEEIEKSLLSEAIRLGKELRADRIELRHEQPLSFVKKPTR